MVLVLRELIRPVTGIKPRCQHDHGGKPGRPLEGARPSRWPCLALPRRATFVGSDLTFPMTLDNPHQEKGKGENEGDTKKLPLRHTAPDNRTDYESRTNRPKRDGRAGAHKSLPTQHTAE